MNAPLRIAMFTGCFPVVSETFILRQIAGLLDLGHDLQLYADTRGDLRGPLQPEVKAYRLLERTTFLDAPAAVAPWELPVWPVTGRTWTPGESAPVRNTTRLAHALPHALRCFARAPGLTAAVLRRSEYGFQSHSLSALYRLSTLARHRRHYDVLHAHFGPVGNSFRFARELWQAPLVVSFHGYDFCTWPRQQGPQIYQKLFAVVDAVTVNSEFTRRRVQALGCPEEKLHLLPVGLKLDAFPFALRTWREGQPVRLLTVARLVEIKGHEFVLRALAQIPSRQVNVRYDIVGDGPLRGRLETLIAELGLSSTVTLQGARDETFIRKLMSEAHLAVLASVSVEGDAEGQGLFLQEAQAAGLPVLATDHGALPEGLLAGKSGLLVPERDADALAAGLQFLIEHPEVWPQMGQAGRALVEQRYDIRNLNQQLAALYRETARRFRPGTRTRSRAAAE